MPASSATPFSSEAPAQPAAVAPRAVRLAIPGSGPAVVATLFAPAGNPRAAAIVAPAMGVVQDFYAPLASWLASRGVLTATFDYRGMGRSRDRPLRDIDVDLLDWARQDCAAVIDAVTTRAPATPLTWIGHSLGGQILPFIPNRERIARIVTVAAGNGYWRYNAPALRARAHLLWYGLVPLTTPILGYFPGRRLGAVGDLPRGAILQWRRWCLHPDYAAGAEGASARAAYAAVDAPIAALYSADDEMLMPSAIESLHGFYRGAAVTLRPIDPVDAGVERIGHFGFFRASRAALWSRYLAPEFDRPAAAGPAPAAEGMVPGTRLRHIGGPRSA